MEDDFISENESVVTLRFIRTAGIIAAITSVANGIGDIFYQGVADGVNGSNMEFMWKVFQHNFAYRCAIFRSVNQASLEY